MTDDRFNISSVETYLDKILKGRVSKNMYAGTLPNTLPEEMADCVLIDCGGAINDHGPYSKGVVNIFLYAQPTSNGRKNVAALSRMEKAINKVLDDAGDETYVLTQLYRDSDYDTNYNMHYIIVAVNLLIK